MLKRILLLCTLLCVLLSPAEAATRALLVACSDFSTYPDLGSEISGNLQMIASAFLGAREPLEALSIEDGTIGSQDALQTAIESVFGEANETDSSILYICTHGVLSSSDHSRAYLLLSDGESESPLSANALYAMISGIQGEKLVILDACYSGAFIGHGVPDGPHLPGARVERTAASPFLSDSSISVLTSADGNEAGWYYDSRHLATGAVSYFASALSAGLGLYGCAEADADGNGSVTLAELHRYLRACVSSSGAQLQSANPDNFLLPTADGAMLSRPLTGFSFGSTLLPSDAPVLDFSFTATRETAVQYRLVEYADGAWNWPGALTFSDDESLLAPGRKHRSLTLDGVLPEESGYLMLQVFSLADDELILCSERLIAVQSALSAPEISVFCPPYRKPGQAELPIEIRLTVPAALTVSVYDAEGHLVRRLASSSLTHPVANDISTFYWNGRGADGKYVPPGQYTITAETSVAGTRSKASCDVLVSSPVSN